MRQRADGAACAHHADHPDKAHAGLEARQRLRDLLRRVLDRCAVAISRRDCLKKTSFPDQSTVDEQDLARHEAKLAAAKSPWSYGRWDAPRIPQHDYRSTGKLSLQLEDKVGHRGVRKTFSDRVALRVEMMVSDIVDAMQGYAKAEDEWLAKQERQRLEYQEQARQAELERRRQALEGRREGKSDCNVKAEGAEEEGGRMASCLHQGKRSQE